MLKNRIFRTDEEIIQGGIYRVLHKEHRLPHEVTLLSNQRFPRCAKCQDSVIFELVAPFTQQNVRQHGQIRLYELPVLDDGEDIAA
jgi:hypothetical protein